jgi:hypothetical protein
MDAKLDVTDIREKKPVTEKAKGSRGNAQKERKRIEADAGKLSVDVEKEEKGRGIAVRML